MWIPHYSLLQLFFCSQKTAHKKVWLVLKFCVATDTNRAHITGMLFYLSLRIVLICGPGGGVLKFGGPFGGGGGEVDETGSPGGG